MFGRKDLKPVRIWVITAFNENTGEPAESRAFRYKCEATRWGEYLERNDRELRASIDEIMLY